MAPRDRLEGIKRGVAAGSGDMSSIQAELEQKLDQAVQDGKIPHAMIYATNADGSFEYKYQTGTSSSEEPVFMLASQTKLLTSLSALQAIEVGLFTLDEDISPLVPEISKHGILTAYDGEDKPVIEECKKPITIRQLLTHSSGATYPMFNPAVIKYLAQKGIDAQKQSVAPAIAERFDAPMVFQPGEGWMYSPGLDWYGKLLERKTEGKYDLESWMREKIFNPLDVSKEEFTFWPSSTTKSKIPELKIRSSEGKLIPNTNPTINSLSTECYGGHGGYCTLSAYGKVLRSLLANDGKILKPETLEEAMKPQLGEASKTAFNKFLQQVGDTMMPGEFNKSIPVSYGLGGMLFLEGEKDRRKKGTMSWSGLFNCFWILDRESGIAYTFGTQVLPPGDAGCKEMEGVAERAVYKMAGVEF